MAVEIEIKMKVQGHETVRQSLLEQGARRVGKQLEVNTFFDRPDHSLRSSDQGLRVRVAKDVENGRQTITMTYKGPRLHGEIKSREEIELIVNDPANAVTFLQRLGLEQTISFQKRRESWQLGDCHVELDEIPHLGFFVEIEGPSEQTVLEIRTRLGLQRTEMVKPSYIALLAAWMEQQGRGEREINFP